MKIKNVTTEPKYARILGELVLVGPGETISSDKILFDERSFMIVSENIKVVSSDEYLVELKKIKGIGSKTAEDITSAYSRTELINSIKNRKKLPFRDDVVEKLKSHFEKVEQLEVNKQKEVK